MCKCQSDGNIWRHTIENNFVFIMDDLDEDSYTREAVLYSVSLYGLELYFNNYTCLLKFLDKCKHSKAQHFN